MTHLHEGDQVPQFSAPDQDGNLVSPSDYIGNKVVIYFYPKDDTPGCTKEACNLRDNYVGLQSKGIAIIGVSTDDEASHQKFIKKYSLPFPLIADTDHKLVDAFGVWGDKKFMGKTYMGTHRVTFLIDEHGKIEHVIDNVETSEHAAQIMKQWQIG